MSDRDGHCGSCGGGVEDDGSSTTECAAGRYGTDEDGTCGDCGGCLCDGAC